MRLDEGRKQHLMRWPVAPLAAGVKSILGSMAKPMHVGNCSRNGLLAAQLAGRGFTSNADALEHHQGFLEVFNGAGHYDVGRILAKWGTPWDIEMPGIAIKQYPCCLSTQAVVDVMIRLAQDHDVRPESVTRVDARISARRLEHTNRPEPRSALDAKLSAQYVLARALVDRELTLSHFEGDRYRDREIQETMKRVHVAPLDAGTLAREGDFFADVAVTLREAARCRQHRSAGRTSRRRAVGAGQAQGQVRGLRASSSDDASRWTGFTPRFDRSRMRKAFANSQGSWTSDEPRSRPQPRRGERLSQGLRNAPVKTANASLWYDHLVWGRFRSGV
jgi:hypothetical protein